MHADEGGKSFYFLKANTCRARDAPKKNERTQSGDDDDVTSHAHTALFLYVFRYILYIYFIKYIFIYIVYRDDDEVARSWVITSPERRSTLVIHCGRRRRFYILPTADASAPPPLMVNYKYAIKPCRVVLGGIPRALRTGTRYYIRPAPPSLFVAGAQIPRV